jgi:hypothetical protein
MSTELAGILTLGIPPMVVGYVVLRRNRMTQWFFLALLLVGLGYLGATGAVNDVGAAMLILLGRAPTAP